MTERRAMHSNGLRCRACILLALAGGLAVGCGRPEKPGPQMGTVTGRVIYQDKPVTDASVVFLPKTPGTRAAAAVTDADGNYSLSTFGVDDGAIVGAYQVSIALSAPYRGPVPEGMSPAYAKELFQNQGEPLIPKKYFSPATSGLAADVKPGHNSFDFTLQD